MIKTVQKWRVTLTYEARDGITVWISDNFASNVMRQIAAMEFTESGLEQPTVIRIEAVK